MRHLARHSLTVDGGSLAIHEWRADRDTPSRSAGFAPRIHRLGPELRRCRRAPCLPRPHPGARSAGSRRLSLRRRPACAHDGSRGRDARHRAHGSRRFTRRARRILDGRAARALLCAHATHAGREARARERVGRHRGCERACVARACRRRARAVRPRAWYRTLRRPLGTNAGARVASATVGGCARKLARRSSVIDARRARGESPRHGHGCTALSRSASRRDRGADSRRRRSGRREVQRDRQSPSLVESPARCSALIPGVGHTPHLEDPASWADVVGRFVNVG